jgi:uncharacterized membrane protein
MGLFLSAQAAERLRQDLREETSRDLRLRRASIAVSLAGMASMAAVALYQTGLVRHLPDPPLRRFDSDSVNASETAYHWGVPDGTITLAGHATNLLMAAIGGRERARRHPWVPIVASAKAAAEAAVAIRYLFYEMPIAQKRWCGYCIVDAIAHIGTFLLTLPEAVTTVAQRRQQWRQS